MRIKIENVIWQFAKAFRKKFVADHPGLEISISVAAAFGALKANSSAEECVVTLLNGPGVVPTERPRAGHL